MEIVGKELDNHNRGFVTATLFSSQVSDQPIDFLVDTGASRTMILDFDVERIGIKYDDLKLSPDPVRGIGGEADAYNLGESQLVFRLGASALLEDMKNILVLKHKYVNDTEKKRVFNLPSLLGMDLLINYTISYRKSENTREIVLER